MEIVLPDINAKNRSFDTEDVVACKKVGIVTASDILAKFQICQQSQDLYKLTGSLTALVATDCDRCGKGVQVNIERFFSYKLRLEEEPPMASEYNCTEEDYEVLYLPDSTLETDEILSEQLILALPLTFLCDEACKGLCGCCGIDLNKKQCKCRETNENSPFAVLKQLYKK